MANVYKGSDVEAFIFDENAQFEVEEVCTKKEEAEEVDVEDKDIEEAMAELDTCGVIECVDEPEVACYRIALECEQNYNKIMNHFYEMEMSVLESTGSEMVYEAADVNKFFANVKNLIKGFWEKVQGIVKKVIDSIGAYCVNNKKFVAMYKGKDIKVPEKKFEGFKFTHFVSDFDAVRGIVTTATRGDIDAINKDLTAEIAAERVKAFNDEYEAFQDKVRGVLCAKSEVKKDDFAKELKIACFGSEEKVDVTGTTFDELIKDLETGKAFREMAKEGYSKSKKAVAGFYAEIAKAEKAIIKGGNLGAGIKLGNCVARGVQGCINLMTIAFHANIRAINANMVQSRSMATYYVAHQVKPEAKTEFVEIELLDLI